MGDGEQIMVRMPLEMRRALEADAERNERTLSQTVRWAIRCYLAASPATEGEERP